MADDALIIPDASALLRLYELPPNARERTLAALNGVRNRIWVARRTKHEFLRRQPSVRFRNRAALTHIGRAFSKFGIRLFEGLRSRGDFSPSFNVAELVQNVFDEAVQLEAFFSVVTKAESDAFAGVEELLCAILVEGNVGSALDNVEFERILRIGPNRMRSQIPPGYRDFATKSSTRSLEDALGDLIFWEEALKFAASRRRRSIIIITAEEKDDWWDYDRGLRSAHPSLQQEMLERTGQKCEICHIDEFPDVTIDRGQLKEANEAFYRRIAFDSGTPLRRDFAFSMQSLFDDSGLGAAMKHLRSPRLDYARIAANLNIPSMQSLFDDSGFAAAMKKFQSLDPDYLKIASGLVESAKLTNAIGSAEAYASILESLGPARSADAHHYNAKLLSNSKANARRRARLLEARIAGICSTCYKERAAQRLDGRPCLTCAGCLRRRNQNRRRNLADPIVQSE